MKYLLDTHTLLWYFTLDESLSSKARVTIEDEENEILVSVVTLWEIAIKSSIGKLPLPNDFKIIIDEIINQDMTILPIGLDDIVTIEQMPFVENTKHKDPFDRLLIVQAQNNECTIITKDKMFKHYDVVTYGKLAYPQKAFSEKR